jgi:hypothetical protein
MITAYLSEQGIDLRFDTFTENLSKQQWESLLDELKSHHIPGLYQQGARSHASLWPSGQTHVMIYITPKTVTRDAALSILKKWNFTVVEQNEFEQ